MLKRGILSVVLLLSINTYTMDPPDSLPLKKNVELPGNNPLYPDQLDELEEKMEVEDLINSYFKENPEENTAENFQYYVTCILNYLKEVKLQATSLDY